MIKRLVTYRLLILSGFLAIGLSGCDTVRDTQYLRARELDKAGAYSEAFQYYKAVAQNEDYPAAQFRLAEMYMKGEGTTRDPSAAWNLLQRVANGPDQTWAVLALNSLGHYQEIGIAGSFQANRAKAAAYFARGAERGDENSQESLERLLQYPEVFVSRNKHEFEPGNDNLATGGMETAYRLFESGQHRQAYELFLWHARRGNEEAQANVAVFLRDGIGVEHDLPRSVAWTYLAARSGNPDAQMQLGVLYRRGEHVPGSDTEAISWLKRAASQEYAQAYNELGVIYAQPYDDEIEPDISRAATLFEKARSLGSTIATVNLGDLLVIAPDKQKNLEKAKQLYMEAARQGSVVGRTRLFELFSIVFEANETLVAEQEPETPSKKVDVESAPTPSPNLTPIQLYAAVSPSVYTLFAGKLGSGDGDQSQGSAVAITAELAITNCHVIEGMDAVGAMIDGEVSLFTLAAGNEAEDICILRSELPLRPVQQTRSFQSLEVGEEVYAIGSPLSLHNTLSEGLISGLRESEGTRYIQTSAPISPGSSGGGLFDVHGQLAGITTLKLKGGENLNFAVSIDEALELLERISSRF